MSKIKTITVSNLKAVSKLTADFNGCTAIVTGRNNSGKSSFLKSIPDRIRGIKPEMILKEDEKEGFAEMHLTTGEKFIWTFNNKAEKLTFITEKNIKSSVTKDIAGYYFPKVFDVDEFLASGPKKQKETLQKLTGIDFTEIDKEYKNAYDQRTFFNKQLTIELAKAQSVDNRLPVEEISYEELQKELNGIEAHNLRFTTVKKGVAEKEEKVNENLKEIEALEEKIKDLKFKNNSLQEDIKKGNEWMKVEKNQLKNNQAELEAKIAKIKEDNEAIRENNKAILQDEVITKARAAAKEWDDEVKRLEAEKLDVIKNASMPEGFGFSEDGITYNGLEFTKEQLSSSAIYIASLKLAAIGLGEVKTLHFDASFLDKNSLAEIEKWANENELQLLIERPDFEAGDIKYELIQTN